MLILAVARLGTHDIGALLGVGLMGKIYPARDARAHSRWSRGDT